MMDDHDVLCRARNHLVDALKTLLNPDIMTEVDFQKSKNHALAGIAAIDDLLRQSDRDPA
jgi:hypothetical protein